MRPTPRDRAARPREAAHRLARRLARRLGRDEDGAMTVFALFIFLLMLIVGGMAVDLMHFETTRARLQEACDRAVLAAADLRQTVPAEEVVADYFRAAGLEDRVTGVSVTERFNFRSVSAEAEGGIRTYFMRLVGVDALDAPAGCTADDARLNTEIVLVLDVSGSMVDGGTARLANLMVAAKRFVQIVLENDVENRVSVSIVPFNGQVNLGPMPTEAGGVTLASSFTGITDRVPTLYGPAFSHIGCVDLPAGVYLNQTIARSEAMPATALADTFTTTNMVNAYRDPNANWPGQGVTYGTPRAANMWCPPTDGGGRSTAGNVVRLPGHDIAALQGQIDGLVGVGATSINAGMRWGMTMLDPASRPMFDELIAARAIPTHFRGRPYDYHQENTRKIIVLMTDGANFGEHRMNGTNGAFRSGDSPIWRATNGQYSILHDRVGTTYDFWVPHLNFDASATTATWPALPRNGVDDDRDGVVDDGIDGGWRVTPWEGTVDEDTDGPQLVDGVLVTVCDDDNNDGRDDHTGAQPCDDDDLDDDGRDDGDDADGDVDVDGVPPTTQLAWPQVWTSLRLSWVALHLYTRAGVLSTGAAGSVSTQTYNDQMNLFRSTTDDANNTPFMDSQLDQMCDRARDSGVVVYGVAFEAPARGQAVIAPCATELSYYFAPSGSEIVGAFEDIAKQINSLRLTQ